MRIQRAVMISAATALAVWTSGDTGFAAERRGEHWVGTWGASPQRSVTPVRFNGQTLRQIVHTSVGGTVARVTLSNAFGTTPLTIGAAHIAVRATGSAIGSGVSALARFDRDVLTQPGVTHVIVLEGINDSGSVFVADQIIAGLAQLIARAHVRGLRIYGGTLTPAGAAGTREANRQAVNDWIRTGGGFDAVIDFDEAVRDPENPNFFLPAYDSGDHLHPSDAGYRAMADAIDLSLFRGRSRAIGLHRSEPWTRFPAAVRMGVAVGVAESHVHRATAS